MIEDVKVIEKRDGCIAYDCEAVSYIILKKGAVASDHVHEKKETVFLMEGNIELVLGSEILLLKAPLKITIQPNTYHKFTALTDSIGLEIK